MDFQSLVNLIGLRGALIVFAGFGAASFLVAVLPPPKTMGSIYGRIWRVINAIGMNWGNGKSVNHPDFQSIVKQLEATKTPSK